MAGWTTGREDIDAALMKIEDVIFMGDSRETPRAIDAPTEEVLARYARRWSNIL